MKLSPKPRLWRKRRLWLRVLQTQPRASMTVAVARLIHACRGFWPKTITHSATTAGTRRLAQSLIGLPKRDRCWTQLPSTGTSAPVMKGTSFEHAVVLRMVAHGKIAELQDACHQQYFGLYIKLLLERWQHAFGNG